ncbi:HNH endonuclease [Gemmiger sp.]
MKELNGGGPRAQVLQYINDRRYWYKSDDNDTTGMTRPTEKRWRNDFSYERQHLVESGHMQSGGGGEWRITEAGKAYLKQLVSQAQDMPSEEERLFTPAFYRKIAPIADGENRYIVEISAADTGDAPAAPPLSDVPRQKPERRASAERHTYPRNPVVAGRALERAGHRCEADPAHGSFLRKDGRFLYMEPHHLIPISFTDYFGVDLDREQNIFSLCSNCHNQIHSGRKEDVRALISKLFAARKTELCAVLGREMDVEEIYQIYGVL